MPSVQNPKPVVVVFSGGQDSTTCLLDALSRHQQVYCISFDYGQKHRLELTQAQKIIQLLNTHTGGGILGHNIIDAKVINTLGASALTRSDIQVPKFAQHDGQHLPATFVPGRNIVFLTLAGIYASQVGATRIITGVCETDFSGYPDCRDIFIKAMNVAINLGIDQSFCIDTPLMWLDKSETWKLAELAGKRLGLDGVSFIREHTLTCYNGIIGDGCGECDSCHLRQRGYQAYLASLRS